MKKKMSANAIACWLEGWVSQTHQVKNNDNTILDVLTPQGELKSFKFANFMYY